MSSSSKIIPIPAVASPSPSGTPLRAPHGQPPEPPEQAQALYEVRKKIYPRAVTGWFAKWRWFFVFATQLVYYGGPWLMWNERQAILFDLTARKFYILGVVFWPQDFIYLTVLLVICAFSLFLFTAVAGRLWCGYACPQTVYTEIFLWIERVIEGDRLKRMKLDQSPLSTRKLGQKSLKHGVWIALSLWTGFTLVAYFVPARELLSMATSFTVPPWETFWILFYGFATYGNAGWMREQVCKYMCPYARFQGAMFDRDTLVITYDHTRGEARGARSRKADYKSQGLGDCIDCEICVQVCPTGIDIRAGQQYECIGCAACIDGCNQVMDKMSYPRGLIRYATLNSLDQHFGWAQMLRRTLRPRVILYTAILWLIIIAAGVTLLHRSPIKVDVIRDRTTLAREVADGQIENVFRLQVMNTTERAQRFRVSVTGLPSLAVAGTGDTFLIEPASTTLYPVAVRAEAGLLPKGTSKFEFHITALDSDGQLAPAQFAVHERSSFYKP